MYKRQLLEGLTPGGSAAGDLQGEYPNPTLKESGVSAGVYGRSNAILRFTVDLKGRLTQIYEEAIPGVIPTGPAGGDLAGSYPAPLLRSIESITVGDYGTAK